MITRDVIRVHNEMAEKYLSEPGSYLVTLYHSDFTYLEILVAAFSDLLTASCVCYTARDHFLFPTSCVSFGKFMVSKGNQLGKGPSLSENHGAHV